MMVGSISLSSNEISSGNSRFLLLLDIIGPPDPKISNFRPPPIRNFISVMVSLGVGKRQTGEVSFKLARVSS